jgi:hypothetical protein
VRLGDVDLSVDHEPSEPATYKVKEIRAHPKFSRVGFYNDIAGELFAICISIKIVTQRGCTHFSHGLGAAGSKVKIHNSNLYAKANNSEGASHR